MKVLQIINSLATGGAEKLVIDTIPILNQKGIETDVLVFNNNNYPFFNQLKRLDYCKVYNFNHNSIYNPIAIFKLIPYIKKYDVIHVHLFPAQYFAVIAKILSFSKTKLIFTEHNTTNNRIKKTIYHFIDKSTYKVFDKVVCISDEILGIMKSYTKQPDNKFVVIENGVNLDKIKQAKPYKKSDIHPQIYETDKLIIQVSAFRDQKDQPTIIKSLKYLPDDHKAIFVGDGVNKKKCIELAKKENVSDRVFFLGVRTDVPNLLKSADYVALSSKYEGLSLSSIEGLASGVPFIASKVPGLIDVIEGAGILFPFQDEKVFANIITELNQNTTKRNQTIKNCMKRADKYDINLMVDKLIKLYKEL